MVVCVCPLIHFVFIDFILSTVKAQGNALNPGNYRLAGSLNVLPNGDVNVRVNAKKQGAGPSLQPPSFTAPTPGTTGFTTGTPSGGTFSTSTGPTTGFSTPTGEGGRMAGIGGVEQK